MQFIDVLVTCPDRQTASRIARVCVDERLAACANIGEQIESIYRWKGEVEDLVEREARAVLDSRAESRLAGVPERGRSPGRSRLERLGGRESRPASL